MNNHALTAKMFSVLLLLVGLDSALSAGLYIWGSRSNGQGCRPAGDGGADPHPYAVTSIVNPVRVYAGPYHTFVLASSALGQTLYACGNNTAGVLGLASARVDRPVFEPAVVPLPLTTAVVLVNLVTGTHTAALLSDGRLMLWGDNSHGQLCSGALLPPHYSSAAAPVTLTRDNFGGCADCHIVAVAAGWRHTVIVTAEPAIYTCGSNDRGQLGIGVGPDVVSEVATPTTLRALAPFGTVQFRYTSAVAGSFHSLVLAISVTGESAVIAFGDNRFGQLGMGTAPGDLSSSPLIVSATLGRGALRGAVVSITATGYTSVFSTPTAAYAVGGNFNGIGGVGSAPVSRLNTPTPMPSDAWIVASASGAANPNANPDVHLASPLGIRHGVLRSVSGVWTWGSDDLGQLGRGSVGGSAGEPQLVTLLPHQQALSVAAGYEHTAVVLGTTPVVRRAPSNGPPLPLRVVSVEAADIPPPAVHVSFTVLDANGVPVSGLTASSITVMDGGVAVGAAHSASLRQLTPDEVGVVRVTTIVVDVSDAMRLDADVSDAAIAALVPLAQTASSSHAVGVIGFDGAAYVYPVSDGFTRDPVAIGQAVVSLRAVVGSDGSRADLATGILHGLVAAREGAAISVGAVTRGKLIIVVTGAAIITPDGAASVRAAIAGAAVEVLCVGVGPGPFDVVEDVCPHFIALDPREISLLRDLHIAAARDTAALGNGTYVMSYCFHHDDAVNVPVDVQIAQGDGRKATALTSYASRRVSQAQRDICMSRPPITRASICDGQCGIKAGFACGRCGLSAFQRSTFLVEDGAYVYFYVQATKEGLYTVQAAPHLSRQYVMLAMSFGKEPTTLVADAVYPNPLTESPALRVGWQSGNATDMYFMIAPCNANGRHCEGQDTSTFPYLVDVTVVYQAFPPPVPRGDAVPLLPSVSPNRVSSPSLAGGVSAGVVVALTAAVAWPVVAAAAGGLWRLRGCIWAH